MQNNVFIISIIWLHNLIDTITIIGRHSPLSRGGHFASGDQEKLCLCTASLVERTRVAVHKQNFLNLLRQNGGRVAKVYYDVILVNLLAGPNNSKVCDEIKKLANALWIFNVRSEKSQ